MLNINNTVKLFLKEYGLDKSDKVYLVAFSGGYDSMCLLHVLKSVAFENRIVAIHLNHGWRGEESDAEENNCRNFCNLSGIDFYSEKLDENVAHTETAARDARYEFFKRCADKFNSGIVFTAHNKNDNAETLIYRICKGTGIKGLTGICENRDIFYRPLLSVSRKQIENYCKSHKLTPNFDSSNADIKYKRNFIRSQIIPKLEKINENAPDMINSLSQIAKDETDIIDEYLSLVSNKITIDGKIQTQKFLKLSQAVQKHLIYNIFTKYNLDYDYKKIQQIFDFIKTNQNLKSGKKCSLSNDLWIFVNDKIIEVITKKTAETKEIHLIKEGKYKIGKKIFEISKFNKPVKKFPKDDECVAYVDLSKFEFDFEIRTRNDGDIIRPFGMSGSQKLKKYLNAKKIPNHEKDNLIIFAQGKEILWVPNYGISDKIKVIDKPTHILKVKGQ